MPLTLNDLATEHANQFAADCRATGAYVRPSPVNTRAGEQLAEKHDRILAIARFELGTSDLVEVIDDLLTDRVDAGAIGHDGAAAYFEARASLAGMARAAA